MAVLHKFAPDIHLLAHHKAPPDLYPPHSLVGMWQRGCADGRLWGGHLKSEKCDKMGNRRHKTYRIDVAVDRRRPNRKRKQQKAHSWAQEEGPGKKRTGRPLAGYERSSEQRQRIRGDVIYCGVLHMPHTHRHYRHRTTPLRRIPNTKCIG